MDDIEVVNGSVNSSDPVDSRILVLSTIVPITYETQSIRIKLEAKKTVATGTATIPFFDCLIMEKISNILN
ncbi:MAG: hypothetical protein ACK5MD_10995 [Flavobacteriales bacterium]